MAIDWKGVFPALTTKFDGSDQLDLQPGEIDLAHPIRPVLHDVKIELGDEILIAREDHDQQQVAGQRQINQR